MAEFASKEIIPGNNFELDFNHEDCNVFVHDSLMK